jgi:GNAT superfamily N-acetyltransferase
MSELRIESLSGSAITCQLQALAEVRMTVFREWPYLYEGSLDYEKHYLDVYLRCPRSLVVLVWDGERCIGATTMLPLMDASADAQKPFVEQGLPLERYAYFGESVLLPAYRGRGIGVQFFEHRERHARTLGLTHCTFCAVERPVTHSLKPADYVPNDAFWTHRGYQKLDAVTAEFSWPDIGETQSTTKRMIFWQRVLA